MFKIVNKIRSYFSKKEEKKKIQVSIYIDNNFFGTFKEKNIEKVEEYINGFCSFNDYKIINKKEEKLFTELENSPIVIIYQLGRK